MMMYVKMMGNDQKLIYGLSIKRRGNREDIMRDNRIDAIKYYSMIGMVLLHSSYILDGMSGSTFLQMAVESIAGIGLPLFFFLSAYFFAIGYSVENMEHKIFSRIKKLAIPYLFWQLFMIKTYGFLGRLNQNGKGIKFIDETYFPSGIKETIRFIYYGWRNPPLWYLLVLLQFIFITPALIVLIKKSKYISFIAIGIVVLINLEYYGGIPYASVPYWFPEYLTGLWVAVYMPSIVNSAYSGSLGVDVKNGGVSACVFSFFGVFSCLLLRIEKYELYNYFKYIGWTLAPMFLLGLSHLIPKKELIYKGQFDAEYIIFCMHYPLIHITATMMNNFIKPIENGQIVLFWLGVIAIVLVCCHLVHYILIHRCQIIYRFLYGKY